ncbi:MAG: transaldolase family protein [Vicinamibacteria bacterium]
MLRPADIHPAVGERRALMEVVNRTAAGKKLAHPAAHAPRIFADTASIDEIRPLKERGIINGVTTNPSLLKRAGAKSWDHAKTLMKDIVVLMAPDPVSLELTELEPVRMIEQARELGALGENVVIKVPIGGYQAISKELDPATGLRVLNELWKADIKTNCTLIFNSTQAFWAANAGATYVSPFLGRVADYMYKHDRVELPPGNSLYYIQDHKVPPGGTDRVANTSYVASDGERKDAGVRLINEIVAIFTNYRIKSEVLAASFRNAAQVTECLLAGADILTIPAAILMGVADHPLSDEGMTAFVADGKVFEN